MKEFYTFVVLLLLNIADAILTIVNIQNHGMMIESNPFMIFLVENAGLPSILLVKIIYLAVLALLLSDTPLRITRKFSWLLFLLIGCYSVVVFMGMVIYLGL